MSSVTPDGKSGFLSMGVSGLDVEARFCFLHTVLKVYSVGPIRGWELIYLGIKVGLIHRRWCIGIWEKESSSVVQSLVFV